jgi:glycine hydroxymethyltransferase
MIPYDERKPLDPSGIRVGTPAVTTRGMKEWEMKQLARIMNDAIEYRNDMSKIVELKNEVKTLCNRFPIYR